MPGRLLIHNARLVDRDGDRPDSAIIIEGTGIAALPSAAAAAELLAGGIPAFDAQGQVVMPSFIDMHAHFRDPGQTHKEDIASGCRAAAAGGFGTVVLMPNTSPVISSMEQAERNDRTAEQLGLAQVIQSVSITQGFDGTTTAHLAALDPAVVPLITEDGREVTDSAVMLNAMRTAAQKGLIVSCHCEDPFLAAAAKPLRAQALALLHADGGTPSAAHREQARALLVQANTLLALAEDAATLRNIRLAEEAGCHLHLCHVSTARCVQAALAAKERGAHVTFEVTPHHITVSGDSAQNVFHIVNPPLRSTADRSALIAALLDGTADAIATDHAPHTAAEKAAGAPGFSGLETAFAACHTTLCREHGMTLSRLSALMSARPAELLGLPNRGLLRPGYEASLTVVAPDARWTVHGAAFASRGTYTPLEGATLTGQVQATFWRGRLVFQRNGTAAAPAS